MIILTAFLNVLGIGLAAFFLRKNSDDQSKKFFWPGLLVKLLGGISVGLTYKYYYAAGDTFTFFDDAVKLSNLGRDELSSYLRFLFTGIGEIELTNQEPRSLFFVGILSIVSFLTWNNYWISSLWFSFFSFLGTWYLFEKLARFFPAERVACAMAFLFFPSVVFWSSGVLKESLAFGALCFLAGIFVMIISNQKLKWRDYPIIILTTLLLLYLKYYWAAVFFPSVAASLIVHGLLEPRMTNVWGLRASWFLIFMLLCFSISFTHPNFYLERFLSMMKENYELVRNVSQPHDIIHYYNLEPSWGSILMNAPWALVSGLFRPLIFEVHTMAQLVAGIENTVLLALALLAFRQKFRLDGRWLLVQSVIAHTLVLCVFLAISTPNFGTLSRYRIGFLPFFVLLLLIHQRTSRWKWWTKSVHPEYH